MLNVLISVTLTLFTIAYPIAWWVDSQQSILLYFPYILAFLWGIKGLRSSEKKFKVGYIGFAVFLLCIGFAKNLHTMYWYPVIINGFMLILFGTSLWTSQSFIERLARLKTPHLPEVAVRYTRCVTQVWCIFFLFNILFLTVLIWIHAYRWWAIYSGGIAYLIMGILFVGEWLIRQRMIDNDER